MDHLSNDHKEWPNQHNNSHKLFSKMGHPVVNLMESQWKLRYNMIRGSQWRQSHCRTNTTIRRKKKVQKSKTMIITVCDLFFLYFSNYSCLTKLHLRCCIGLELNILTWSAKVLKGIGVTPMIWRKYGKFIHRDPLKIHFHPSFSPIKFFAFNIKWTKQSYYQLIDVDCGFVINFCIVCLVKAYKTIWFHQMQHNSKTSL